MNVVDITFSLLNGLVKKNFQFLLILDFSLSLRPGIVTGLICLKAVSISSQNQYVYVQAKCLEESEMFHQTATHD